MTKTCTSCRSRKMRCDGTSPICGPCSRARKPIDCVYLSTTSASQVPKASLLQKGAACLACRRKKKKCDARRPFCRTCEVAGKESECLYDDDVLQDLTTTLILRNTELEERLAVLEAQQAKTTSTSFIEFHPSGPDIWQNRISSPLALPGPCQPHLNVPAMAWAEETFIRIGGQALLFEDIGLPQIPSAPLQLEEQITNPISDATHLRALYLANNSTLGFYLRPSKCQAIEVGDLSGAMVHPALVHLSPLIGGIYCSMQHGLGSSNADFELQMRLVTQSMERQQPEPVTLVMIYCLVSWYLFFKRELTGAQAYLSKAHDVTQRYQLKMPLPNMVSILALDQPDDDTKEMVTALCQMVYLDKAAELVLKLPPVLPKDFDIQLKKLPTFHPWLCRHSVVVMRCRGIYFLQRALNLSASAPATGQPGIDTSDWYEQYWETLEEISHHVSGLTTEMLKASMSNDSRQAVALKVCLVICLSAQLELHRLPGFYHLESRQKVIDGISEIVGLTRGFREEDSSLLDPILGVCWTIVATALRQEKQAFVDMSSFAPDGNWARAFSIMITCASKVGSRIPFLEHALYALHEVAIEPQPQPPIH